jgi:hypothetical protein
MKLLRIAGLALVAFCGSSLSALAQQDIVADSKHHKLLFENEKVRVLRATFGPGEKATAPFDANEVVLVRLKGSGPLSIHLPDGKVVTGKAMSPGEAAWAPAGRIQPENKSTELVEFIVIEPKK